MRTIYGPNFVPTPSSNIEITVNISETKDVTFTLVTNKKHKKKKKATFLSSISSSNFRSKTLLILQAFPLSKAITTHLVLKLVATCSGLTVIYSLVITTSKIIRPQIASLFIFLASKPRPKVK